MMKDQSIAELSEIVDTFNLAEIRKIVESQVFNESVDVISGAVVDQFTPIYDRYRGLLEGNDNPDILFEARNRFINVCIVFLKAIEERYAIAVDQEWLQSHINDIPALTQALYSFFVLDHQSNVVEALYNYIIIHLDDLYTIFEGKKQKKDAATLSLRKMYADQYAVIIANIYDICAYIFDSGFRYVTDFFNCMNQDYIHLALIKELYEKDVLTSVQSDDGIHDIDFIDQLGEIFSTNVTYKGIIAFLVVNRLQNHIKTLNASE